MATSTTNIGLVKPELSDNFNLQEHFNNNWDKIDNAFGDIPVFSTVATSGSYNDLIDKPVIPTAYDDTALQGRVSAVENSLSNKVSFETGIISNVAATYDENSKMNGTYTLMGNLCFVMATATIKGGWGDIDYQLPVAAINNTACLATDGSKSYRVSTSTENSHVYIHRVEESELQADGTISFTLIYKYI